MGSSLNRNGSARGFIETKTSCIYTGPRKMEMAGEVGVCLQPFTSELQALLSQLFGKQGFISRGGWKKAFRLQRKKMGVMNIAVSRKKMNPPNLPIEEWSEGGSAQPFLEALALNRFSSSCRGKQQEYLPLGFSGFWFHRRQHLAAPGWLSWLNA